VARGRFETVLDPPDVEEQRVVVRQMAELGRPGGAIYDALIGVTARRAGLTLISADRRAAAIYELLEIPFQML
jgi:predicted nucleic acid-binding protein